MKLHKLSTCTCINSTRKEIVLCWVQGSCHGMCSIQWPWLITCTQRPNLQTFCFFLFSPGTIWQTSCYYQQSVLSVGTGDFHTTKRVFTIHTRANFNIVSWEPEGHYIAVQRCSVENQKGTIAIKTAIAAFWFSMEHLCTVTPFWLSTDDIRMKICLSLIMLIKGKSGTGLT